MTTVDILELRDRLIKQKALNEKAKADNQKIYTAIEELLNNLDQDALDRLISLGFSVQFLKTLSVEQLQNPETLQRIKQQLYASVSEMSSYLDKANVD